MGVYYMDGEFLPREEAVLPVTDMAILRGYGVFDFLRTYGGRPFHLSDHIKRLRESAALVELSCPWGDAEIAGIVMETLSRNGFEESNVRMVITGGDSPDSITPDEKPRLLVMVNPQARQPEAWYREGVGVVTSSSERFMPGAKSTNYTQAIVNLRRARKAGAVESLYVDREGHITEGTTTNFFAFMDGRLLTPGSGILSGITRKVVLGLANGLYEIDRRDIHLDEIPELDEAFIAASNKEIVPVVRIDDRVLGEGRPGVHTTRMMDMFRAYTDAYAEGGKR